MKSILKLLLFISILGGSICITHANDTFTGVTIQSTVDIPWMSCTKSVTSSVNNKGENINNGGVTVYDCDVKPGFQTVMGMLAGMIKYFTYIAMISAVLFIVVNGIMYSMSGVDSGMKDEAKKRITKTLIGIIILLLSGYILSVFFPWIYG